MKDGLIISALSLLPRKRGAHTMGVLARTGLSKLGVRLFIAAYGVDASTAARPLSEYRSLTEFFTRRLKPGARPIHTEPAAMVSPCDAKVAAVGRTQQGRIEVAVGRELDVAELVGRPISEEVDVAVLYLSPKDYHRVHVPREGRITRWSYAPGDLWPVFPAAVRKVDGLFEKNERMAVELETSQGRLDVVLVGAFGVGRIELVTTGLLANTGAEASSADVDLVVERGGDLGVFHLGSTVVLVCPADHWKYGIEVGDKVAMGEQIAIAV